jgi:sugar phosphate isomerase/epimerase
MHRRSVLQLLGSMLGSSMLPAAASAAAPSKRWKTAIGLNGFMSSSRKFAKTYPLWEILDFASQAGFDGVELVDGWPMGVYPKADETERISALKRLYDHYDLKIFSVQLGAGGAFDPDPAERQRWLEAFHGYATFAKKLGCDCVGLWPGGPLRDQSIDEAIDRLSESFSEVSKIAAELDLIAAFEIEPPFVFNQEDHLQRILDQAGSATLKTIYDSSHFDLMSKSTGRPHEMLKRIGVENIGYVHLTDTDGTLQGTSRHLPCGDGHVDIVASLETLREGGFQGWIMIDAWQIPDPYDASRKGKLAIERAVARS